MLVVVSAGVEDAVVLVMSEVVDLVVELNVTELVGVLSVVLLPETDVLQLVVSAELVQLAVP